MEYKILIDVSKKSRGAWIYGYDAHVPLCAMPWIDKANTTVILRFWDINCSTQCDWSAFLGRYSGGFSRAV
jgi:hypothetical protein